MPVDVQHRPRLRGCRATPPRAAALVLLWALAWLSGCQGESDSPDESPPGAAGTAPPNVILITIDTLRADALGSYGQALPTSPRIDRMASQGVLFEQTATSVPSTLPSHASILTGKQPYAHGVRANAGYQLTAENVTLAEILRDYGYRTAAEIAAPVIGRRTQLNQGFGQYRDLESFDATPLEITVNGEPLTLQERSATDVTNHGLRFIAQNRGSPFFLWLHYFDPHAFYRVPDPYHQRIPESEYHAQVLFTDEHVGKILDALGSLGVRDRTLVVLTSDHGESLGEHGELTHSFFVYEATMRVPLIFWGPGLLGTPRRISAPVRTVDITPTILDLLGLPPLANIQGVSLRPLIEGTRRDLGLTAYGESTEPLQVFGASVLRFVREGDWKYVHKVRPELYELTSDPGEEHNLWEKHPERGERLRQRLYALIATAPDLTGDTTVEIDDTTREHLQQLGYLALAPALDFDEAASLEVEGADPAVLVKDVEQLALGLGLLKAKKLDEAEQTFQALAERHPQSFSALQALALTLRAQGKQDELEPVLRQGIELESGSVEFHVQLAGLSAADGRFGEAEDVLREALELQPCEVEAWVMLSQTLHQAHRYGDQVEALEAGLLRCPEATDLANDLAYALATTPDDELRDGARALELARRAVREAGSQPAYLDTLASAMAESGDFAGAVEASRQALELVESRGAPEHVLAEFRRHLELFEAGQPIREGSVAEAPAAGASAGS